MKSELGKPLCWGQREGRREGKEQVKVRRRKSLGDKREIEIERGYLDG